MSAFSPAAALGRGVGNQPFRFGWATSISMPADGCSIASTKRLASFSKRASPSAATSPPVLSAPWTASQSSRSICLCCAWRERTPQESCFLLLGSDGASRHLTWNATPLADADGTVRGVVASLVVAPFEPDWQRLAGLAHDLRTPLQALRLLTPLLENTTLSPEGQAILERIRAGVERTLSISHDLLEWTRGPVQGGRNVEHGWLALEPFLNTVAGEQAILAQNKGVGWRTDFDAARGLEVYVDRVRLGRLMSNLMSNAIRYTSRGEIHSRAHWRGAANESSSLFVLSVEDTGSGISPEDQESIFQPFERGKAGKESDLDGSGMGLAVVDRLIEELGLTMEIFSQYGRGSKFEVLLPADCIRKP